mmetsp:Transcript_13933/g.26114  ORF Transcript_13933/g.26114 Transcript_13933/m.26114 type:complete len:97 (+) Transcript_13933:116-406(+)
MPVRSELVHQIFKYSVLELNASELTLVSELIRLSTEHASGFLPREAVAVGISHTIEGVSDLKLDNPMAPKYLATVVECLAAHGLVEAEIGFQLAQA